MTKHTEAELISRVNSLQQEGRYRTALDQIFPLLDRNPNDELALKLAASVLSVAFGPGHKYDPPEPITGDYFSDTRFDSVFCECEGVREGQPCRRHWVPNPWLSEAMGVIMFDPVGGICPKCNKVFCRECSHNRKNQTFNCQDCETRLVRILKPNGRTPQQTRRRKERFKLVLMLHEGPVPPDDEYLEQKFRRISPDILNETPEIKVFPVFPWPNSKDELWIKAKTLLPLQDYASDSVIIDDYFFSDDEGNHFFLIKVYELTQNIGTVRKAKLLITAMNFLRNLFGKKTLEDATPSSSEILPTQLVEDIVENLRQKPPGKELCYMVLFGDRPLTAKLQGECILCFTRKSNAEEFMTRYQDIYYCTKSLSALVLGQMSELWAMLNNKAKDTDYEPPYGLVINFNYAGQPYSKYSVDDLKRIGLNGLKKGFSALPR
ncbi:MAG: hypothetical protein HS126_32030 [Anaerolineales bacterium]|nr:hypothetical protein [Anaerolineales bacterium]